jgi:glyoxylate/hydroxypyruvate reductase A
MAASLPVLTVATPWDNAEAWRTALAEAAPEFDVRLWGEAPDPARVVACAVWHPPALLFERCPNLRVVHALGAGVEHLLQRSEVRPDLPLLRLVDPVMTERLAQWALAGTLFFQRRFDRYLRQQRERRWLRHDHEDAGETTVGVLGLGVMGRAIAALLRRNGFQVIGWSRLPKELPGLGTWSGSDGLRAVASRSAILIAVLPLTGDTRSILDGDLFAAMPEGGFLINAGRGDHLVPADLMAALDTGRLDGALLDVFPVEPLPADDPLWHHPKVFVHPHAAAISNPRTGAIAIAEGIRAVLRGERPANLVDRERGY